MPAAISSESADGVSASPSPTSTSVRQQRPRIGARHDRLLLAQEGFGPRLLRHDAHARSELLVVLPVAVDEHRKLQRGNLGEASGLREGDLRLAPLGLLGRLRLRRGIEPSLATRSGAWRSMVKAM